MPCSWDCFTFAAPGTLVIKMALFLPAWGDSSCEMGVHFTDGAVTTSSMARSQANLRGKREGGVRKSWGEV